MGQHRQLVTWDNTAEQWIKSLFVCDNSQHFNSPETKNPIRSFKLSSLQTHYTATSCILGKVVLYNISLSTSCCHIGLGIWVFAFVFVTRSASKYIILMWLCSLSTSCCDIGFGIWVRICIWKQTCKQIYHPNVAEQESCPLSLSLVGSDIGQNLRWGCSLFSLTISYLFSYLGLFAIL